MFARLEDIGTYDAPNLEAIARLEPDLIIGLPYEVDPIYEQLSAIAPTVVIDLVAGDRLLDAHDVAVTAALAPVEQFGSRPAHAVTPEVVHPFVSMTPAIPSGTSAPFSDW